MSELEASVYTDQVALYNDVVKLRQTNVSVPHIDRYFPKTKHEIELQQFNLYGNLPQRLTTEEDIVMWILECEHINRANVCKYLGGTGTNNDQPSALNITNHIRGRREDIPRNVLRRLANKICALDVAKGFVEGMKFFVPVVGCWDAVAAFTENEESNTINQSDTTMLKRILNEYAVAHMKYSDKPIFPVQSINDNNISVIVDIALCILSLSKVLHEGIKSSSAAMSDFVTSLRDILRDQPIAQSVIEGTVSTIAAETMRVQLPQFQSAIASPASTAPSTSNTTLTMSMKTMTDLFVATSTGLPFVSLSSGSQTGHHPAPSYLFASPGLSGSVTLGYDLAETFQPYFARLTSDALYLFETTEVTQPVQQQQLREGATVPKEGKLWGCIPLDILHLRMNDSSPQSALLTLVPLQGDALSVIHYHTSSDAAPERGTAESVLPLLPYCGPRQVSYHPKIYLDLSSASSSTSSGARVREVWTDAIESAVWEWRAHRTTLLQQQQQ